MEALLGGLMMGGAVLGGAVSSTISASKGISDACDQLDSANNAYQQTKSKWTEALKDLAKNKQEIETLNQHLNTEFATYKSALNTQMDTFRQRQLYTNVFIGVFILVIILSLLLKYFNIYSRIWNLITK